MNILDARPPKVHLIVDRYRDIESSAHPSCLAHQPGGTLKTVRVRIQAVTVAYQPGQLHKAEVTLLEAGAEMPVQSRKVRPLSTQHGHIPILPQCLQGPGADALPPAWRV